MSEVVAMVLGPVAFLLGCWVGHKITMDAAREYVRNSRWHR